jgi:hypothetical protein
LARKWDKNGERTIGVITKIDDMDKGTSAKIVLQNDKMHLKHGYYGIVNRSQKDINNKVTIEGALQK